MTTTYSNLLPSGKEEVFLRELLSRYNQEFAAVSASIASTRQQIESDQVAITHLEASLSGSVNLLEVYEGHRGYLGRLRGELAVCSSELERSSKKGPAFTRSLYSDSKERIQACNEEAAELKRLCKKLRVEVNGLKEEIRCQRHHLHFTGIALRTSLLNGQNILRLLRAVHDSFRPIKRLPDEIWLEILEVAIDQGNNSLALDPVDYVTSSVAMSFSQVCRKWRRLILSSPKLWATIHCSAISGKSLEKRAKLMDLLLQRAQGAKVVVVDKRQYRSQREWGCVWWPDFASESSRSLWEYTYRTILSDGAQSMDQHYGLNGGMNPAVVILEAAAPGEDAPISDELIARIKNTRSVRLLNIMLRPGNPIVSQKLRRLMITIDSPLPISGINIRSYPLLPLLGDSLRSLSLSHYDPEMVSWEQGSTINLPDLHTLSITPHEYHIISGFGLPNLSTLTISLPHGPLRVATDDWVKNLAILCQTISTLTLDWIKPEIFALSKSTPVDIIDIFTKLHPEAQWLSALKLMAGTLEGPKLVSQLEKMASKSKKLANLTIDGCVGLSQADCELLGPMVGNLEVFRTYHEVPST